MTNTSQRKSLIVALVVAVAALAMVTSAVAQEDVERAFARATELHQSGDIEGAIRGYESILAKHPERVDVRSNLGAAFSRLGRYEDAIAQYQQALKIQGAMERFASILLLRITRGD